MSELSASALGLAIMAGIAYLWLRAVAGNRRAPALDRAKSHSFWCALIAFFASTSGQGTPLWSIEDAQTTAVGIWLAALGPALWMGAIYLIGSYSWPRELKSVRSASLEPRSLSTPMPRSLLATVAVIALLACGGLWFVYGQPGAAPTPALEIVTSQGTEYVDATGGRISGEQAAGYFAVSIASVLVAALAASVAILRRPPLEGLSHHDNQVLRSVWLNRLLRMSGYLLAVILGSMFQYTAAASGNENTPAGANLLLIGISLLMFFWAPKAQFEAEAKSTQYSAFGRAREFQLAVVFVTTLTAILVFYIAQVSWEHDIESDAWDSVAGRHAEPIMLSMMTVVLFYLAAGAGFALYAHLRAGKSRALPRMSRPLPVYVYAVAGIVSTCGIYLAFFPWQSADSHLLMASAEIPALVILTIILASLAAIWWARNCAVPWKINEREEIWCRQVMELRILRTSSAALLAMPSWAYDLGPVPMAAAVIVLCIPAMVVLEQPKASLPNWQAA